MNKPLASHAHFRGVITAHFNPLDGSKLLTNDQEDEVRVYQGPQWDQVLSFRHHHKQFQHLTPIKVFPSYFSKYFVGATHSCCLMILLEG